MEGADFKYGDKVVLKSGGPPMKVIDSDHSHVFCEWVGDDHLRQRCWFVRETIVRISDPDKEKGLYPRWNVRRLEDVHNKHNDCLTFVLDIKHDKYAKVALEAYIQACVFEYPQLAADLAKNLKVYYPE